MKVKFILFTIIILVVCVTIGLIVCDKNIKKKSEVTPEITNEETAETNAVETEVESDISTNEAETSPSEETIATTETVETMEIIEATSIAEETSVVVEIETKVEETEPLSTTPPTPTYTYTEEDLYILSHVIYGEASGASRELKIGVGSVVLNRVKDPRFPNTIKEVVFQRGQYACTWDGNYNKIPNQETIDIARYLLENGSQMPDYVIFQAEFRQGKGVYQQIGNTYFCY